MTMDQQEVTAGPAAGEGPRVFISYAHDSAEHKEQVRRFCTFLREKVGIDAHLDQWYDDGRRDWSEWAIEQLNKADFILIVASPAYKRRADGTAPPDEGRGARFEAMIIRDNLTRNLPKETRRMLPVVLPGRSVADIPTFLCAHSTTHYPVADFTLQGIESLLLAFSGVPKHSLPKKGRYVGSPFVAPSATSGPSEPSDEEPARGPRLLTSDLAPVARSTDVRVGGADLGGTHYGDSVVYRSSLYCVEPKGVVEYNLGRRYRAFESVVGVLDDARESGQIGYFQIYLDGVVQPQVNAAHGTPRTVRCDVSGVLRLRLVAYRPDTVVGSLMAGVMMAGGRSNHLPELAWGNPLLFE